MESESRNTSILHLHFLIYVYKAKMKQWTLLSYFIQTEERKMDGCSSWRHNKTGEQ